MTGPKPPDIRRIVEALERRGVEYLLVGGVAATAHGAERLTGDADTVVRRTTVNLEATAAALRDLNAHLLVEGLSDNEALQSVLQIPDLLPSRCLCLGAHGLADRIPGGVVAKRESTEPAPIGPLVEGTLPIHPTSSHDHLRPAGFDPVAYIVAFLRHPDAKEPPVTTF